MKDLLILIPDLDYESALSGLFTRFPALGLRSFTYDTLINTERDPGCRCKSPEVLRPYVNLFSYALVLFDFEGCGAEHFGKAELETSIERELARNGWGNRSAVIVVDPEIEAWVWSDSPHVPEILNWQGHQQDLRTWLRDETEFWPDDTPKPRRPKEAMLEILRVASIPKSSSIFRAIGERVSVNRCVDPAFNKLKEILSDWFGT